MRYIGDVHGKFREYARILDSCNESIQIGDMGVGFPDKINGVTMPPEEIMKPNTHHRFIRGNHDSPLQCRSHPQWIYDGKIENDTMFIGGAYSIDKAYRIPGVSYWKDEELSYDELQKMIAIYQDTKPRIMITHECPENVSAALFPRRLNIPSMTRNAFQCMIDVHQPELWIFGHWHMNRNTKCLSYKTQFVCLDELSYMDI